MSEQIAPRKYQGYGIVEGELVLDTSPKRLVIDAAEFPVYFSVPKSVQRKHLPRQAQRFSVFPFLRGGALGFRVLKVSPEKAVGLNLKGCWEQRQDNAYLVVYRNTLDSANDSVLRILIPVLWENAPVPDGQFWELKGEVVAAGLKITEAQGPFDPPPKATRPASTESDRQKDLIPALHRVQLPPPIQRTDLKKVPRLHRNPSSRKTAPPQAVTIVSAKDITPLLTIQEIRAMATPAKVQVTCKINQVPAHHQLSDQRIEFFLDDGNKHLFTVRMKPKLFKKLTDHGYAQWVAAITGEMGVATETGFELQNAAVQVFEKKAPPDGARGAEKVVPKEAQAPAQQKAIAPLPPKPEAERGKRKGRLESVQIR